jgi:hypothetical protein
MSTSAREKAGELDVELNVNEGLELDRQDIAIPAGVLRKLVIGDHIGPALRLGQVFLVSAPPVSASWKPFPGAECRDRFASVGDRFANIQRVCKRERN